jgi:DNA-binding transcriptional regulator YhcF (GntR family)
VTVAKASVSNELSQRALEQRWSAPVIAAGYTVLPSIVLKRQKKLGLDSLDLNIVMHLLSYWWKGSDLPFPSKRSLAEAIGVDQSTIRRRIQKLEAAGYLKRIGRRGSNGISKSNRYDLTGLIEAIKPLAAEENELIKQRQLKREQQIASKKPPTLKVVK